ncbi:MAG: hypothetical protein ACC662_07145 [Planctomycetota bacterium]
MQGTIRFKHALFLAGATLALVWTMGESAFAWSATVQSGDAQTTPGGNVVFNNGGEPVLVEAHYDGPPDYNEIVEVTGNQTEIWIARSGSTVTVDGDDTTVDHRAEDTTCEVVGSPTDVKPAPDTSVHVDTKDGKPKTKSTRTHPQ